MRKVSVAILASRATRPVRWRRHLRAACFWLAVALGTAAVAKELLGPFIYVLMLPPLGFGLRELDGAGRLRHRCPRRPAPLACTTVRGVGAARAGGRGRAHPPAGGRRLALHPREEIGVERRAARIRECADEGLLAFDEADRVMQPPEPLEVLVLAAVRLHCVPLAVRDGADIDRRAEILAGPALWL